MAFAQATLRHRDLAQALLSRAQGVLPGEECAKSLVDLFVAILADGLAGGHPIHLAGLGTIAPIPGRTSKRVLKGVVQPMVPDRTRLRIRTANAMVQRLNPGRPKRRIA